MNTKTISPKLVRILFIIALVIPMMLSSLTLAKASVMNSEIVGWGSNNARQTTSPSALTGVVAVSAGETYNLALKADGTVAAWGMNGIGQSPTPSDLIDVTAITAGKNHNVALKSDGSVVGWGYNPYGDVTPPAGLTGVVAVDAGLNYSLALKNDGTVVFWGYNDGTSTPPIGLAEVTAIAAGAGHSLALKSNGTVVVWGRNTFGEQNIPPGLTGVVAIAAGQNHSLALKGDGTVVGWGHNQYGQSTIPSDLTSVVAIAAGRYHSLALKSDGTVVAWGRNDFGQTDIPSGLTNVSSISAGFDHNWVRKNDGTLVAWGRNDWGQASLPFDLADANEIATGSHFNLAIKSDGTVVGWGANNYGQTNIPSGLVNVIAIDAGESHSLALKSDGTVVGWGSNIYGQSDIPSDLTNVTAIASGIYHNLALKNDGTIVGWGYNVFGQAEHPVGLVGVTAIAAGYKHSLALKSDGTVFAWGDNTYGQTNIPSGLTDVTAIAAGTYHNLALKSDGSVVVWGDNYYGQTNIPSDLTGVIAIAAGEYHSLALKSDGTVVGWGSNEYGRATPPTGLTDVFRIAAGAGHSLALVSQDNTSPIASHGGPYLGVVNTSIAFDGSLSSDLDGNPLTYYWTFGDGSNSTAATPSHTYNATGTYKVCLSVNDGTIKSAPACTQAIVSLPNTAPTANPGGPYLGAVNTTISFDGSFSSDPERDPLTYAWIFGDGSTGTGSTTTHSYMSTGNYSVCLTVSDGSLSSTQACAQAVVFQPNRAPIANPGGPYLGDVNASIAFDGSLSFDPDGDSLSYAWTFGDGSTGTSVTLYHNYIATGSYNVCLTVSDGSLSSAPACTEAGVSSVNTAPTANPGGPYLGGVNTSIAFDGSLSSDPEGDPMTYAWTFGDGSTGTEAAPSHSYTATGTYSVCLTVSDGLLSSAQACTEAEVSQVNTAPTANPGGPYLGAINTSIAFDGSLSSDPDGEPLTYAWTFGDGSTGTELTPAHTYTASGLYTVCLTVSDGTVNSTATCTFAVIYDPSDGFVTGGGSFNSPAGAYKPDPSLTGPATFGFVAKYQKGGSVPVGSTAFEFDLAGLSFTSESYDWLLVNQGGTNAQFKGTGLINGLPDSNGNAYKFMIWAGDGVPDTLRIRIWWEDSAGAEHDVYDNGTNQAISAGNIKVHTSK